MADAIARAKQLQPSQYAWMIAGAGAAAAGVYLLASHAGIGSVIAVATLGVLLYRRIRHQRQRLLESFVRKVARIPEVRVTACQQGRITVVVDRAVSQLYGRIHRHLNDCNRKLFYGEPMTVAIRHDLTDEELRQLLAGPGVHYVRPEAGQPRTR